MSKFKIPTYDPNAELIEERFGDRSELLKKSRLRNNQNPNCALDESLLLFLTLFSFSLYL